MKIDSSSLKEDVTRRMKNSLPDNNRLTAEDKASIDQFVLAAIEFGTYVVDHDKIVSLEDLKKCTEHTCARVVKALNAMTGH